MQKGVLLILLLSGALSFSHCSQSNTSAAQTSMGGAEKDTCNDPDANINCCFLQMPSELASVMLIANAKEPGEKMVISGTLYKSDGKTPEPGVIMYAYHTDNTGHYSKKGGETGIQKWHGYLHGWCKTDAAGHYEIHSIRPACYPGNTIPAHIHAALKEPGKAPYYINDFVFKDDSLIGKNYLSHLHLAGGSGVVDVRKGNDGVWRGIRDIVAAN